MGTDIHGYIECRTWKPGLDPGETAWQPAVDLALLGLYRDYAGFAVLFGVRDIHDEWRPVAAGRGLPADVSGVVLAAYDMCEPAVDATWIGWGEVCAIDWDEPAAARATRIARYRVLPDGRRELVHREDWSRGFTRASGIDVLSAGTGSLGGHCAEGDEWQTGTTVFRAERDRRRDLVPADGPWEPIWSVMRTLAGVHGGQNVRLVVWFD
ncbi:hypothetical protein [Yinghuangia soli]|uniref:Uncharacterized protein n=1 Tax=Yinghuangia soli TaxID=2908204 RepID=A0AA41U3G0_9ACTN|nr:hypothetical protein [Yinghuangia soli]MCF2531795.1 hypothetical protein [Yinghuangia soli]